MSVEATARPSTAAATPSTDRRSRREKIWLRGALLPPIRGAGPSGAASRMASRTTVPRPVAAATDC